MELERIEGNVTYFCHKISFLSLFSFPLIIVIFSIYKISDIKIQLMDDITLGLLYLWLIFISVYLGRIPRLAWNNKNSNPNTKVLYWSLFPIFSTFILIISLVQISSNYAFIEVKSEWQELITFYLSVFLVTEIFLDYISLVKHGKDSNSNKFDKSVGIFEDYQSKFFTYNRTCWFIFLSGIGSIYIGLTSPGYLAVTGVVLSIEHILAGFTD